jgi:hypothetical protein
MWLWNVSSSNLSIQENVKMGYIFWDMTLCNPVEAHRRFGETYSHLQGRRVSQASKQKEAGLFTACFLLFTYLAYSSTLKMEAVRFLETSMNLKLSVQRRIAKDSIPRSHRSNHLKSNADLR